MTENSRQSPERKLTDRDRANIRAEHSNWLRHIAIAAIDGVLIGVFVGIAIIWLDINKIGTMLANTNNQTGYTLMLLGGLAHTFGMVAAGMSIWLKATQEEK